MANYAAWGSSIRTKPCWERLSSSASGHRRLRPDGSSQAGRLEYRTDTASGRATGKLPGAARRLASREAAGKRNGGTLGYRAVVVSTTTTERQHNERLDRNHNSVRWYEL